PGDRASQQLAEALDQVDRRLNNADQAQPGGQAGENAQQSGEQVRPSSAQQSAQQSARQAAEAQAQAMQRGRFDARGGTAGEMPGEMPGQPGQPMPGMASEPTGGDLTQVAEGGSLGDRPEGAGVWGNLPPRMVDDLLEGRRDTAPAQYRDLVEAYYRAVARRARQSEAGEDRP
ncbi:MAG: hypothetical protein AAGK78_11355, partial [Planctomycetota bacterium]